MRWPRIKGKGLLIALFWLQYCNNNNNKNNNNFFSNIILFLLLKIRTKRLKHSVYNTKTTSYNTKAIKELKIYPGPLTEVTGMAPWTVVLGDPKERTIVS